MRYRVTVLITILVSSCAIHKDLPESEIVISLKKTPCMGDCPVYTLEIYKDRSMVFEGKRNAILTGDFFSRLSRTQLKELQEAFTGVSFFNLKDEYTTKVTDLPTTYIYYSNGAKSKRIKDYYGAPEKLKELEDKVEQLIETSNWKKR